MNESTTQTMQPARIPSPAVRAFWSAVGAMIATAAGLSTIVVIGIICWAAIRGIHGIEISAAAGAVTGFYLRKPGSRPARALGGGIGGAVAGYFVLAMGDVLPPGSMEWALRGSGFAAMFALPTAALIGGIVGLLIAGLGYGRPLRNC